MYVEMRILPQLDHRAGQSDARSEQLNVTPGPESQRYACCVRPQGSMEGEYSMMVLSQEDGQWADVMEVIRPLALLSGCHYCRCYFDTVTCR